MNKVVIADDDFLVRTYLKQMIPWEEHGLTIVGDAKNGQEATEIMKREGANILISDMSMPIMDGIELTRWTKQNFPSTHILILSCHDDFVYVKEAMKLGIDDYILKNDLTPDILLDALNKIQDLHKDDENNNPSNKNFDEEQSAIIDRNKSRQEFLKCFDNSDELENPAQLLKFAKAAGLSFNITAALIILPKGEGNRDESFFNAFGEMSSNVCKNFLGDKIQSMFFVSSDEKFLHWGLLINFTEENNFDVGKSRDNLNDVSQFLEQISERLKNFSKRYFNLDMDCIIISPQNSIEELSYQWRKKLDELRNEDQLHPAIRSALKYINEHYNEDLSQTIIADEVYLNPAYFSTLFKKSVGKGFSEYLVDLRIEHVKHRLETTTEKIQDIAMSSGFNDYQYFCKLFKKATGMSPSSYRQKFFH